MSARLEVGWKWAGSVTLGCEVAVDQKLIVGLVL